MSKTHGYLGASPDGIITDQEESTPGVVEFNYIQVKPGENLTDVLLRQHICLRVQHKDNEIIQLNKILLTVVPANVCHRISLGSSCSPGGKWRLVL